MKKKQKVSNGNVINITPSKNFSNIPDGHSAYLRTKSGNIIVKTTLWERIKFLFRHNKCGISILKTEYVDATNVYNSYHKEPAITVSTKITWELCKRSVDRIVKKTLRRKKKK